MKKIWKWIALALAVLGVGVLTARHFLRRMPVNVKEVSPETIRRRVVEDGIVRAVAEYDIYPRHRDRVVSVLVEEGDRVTEGEALLRLDVRELRYAQAELKGLLDALEGEERKLTDQPREGEVADHELAIRQAEARRDAVRREYERLARLHVDGATTEREYDLARDELTDASYALERRRRALQVLRESYEPPPGSFTAIAGQRTAYRAQVDRNRFLMEEYEIRAPAAGVVGRLRVEEQEMVDPQFPLLTVFRDDQMEVEAEVLAVDVLDLHVDMTVELKLDREGREVTFPGKIIRIAPQAEKDLSPLGLEERRVKVTVAPEIPTDLRLGPGYEVDAVFTTHELTDKLVVPKRSLFTDNGEDILFVVEGGRARLRRVTLGFAGRREQVVEEGLEAGDLVILDPRIDGLQDGVRVAPDRFRQGESHRVHP